MAYPTDLYAPPLGLLTDLYQLTMAFAAFKAGIADRQAEFHLTFRKNPFEGGFTVVCGLESAAEYLEHHRFAEDDLAYLRSLRGRRGPLFDDPFLDWLRALHVALDVDAMPEGTVAFPHEPILRVRGPAVAAMLVETPLLTLLNFQTLVATKAARVCLAANGRPVIEFGLRRAQGPDGGVSAARAAYVGGCEATSNLLAGKLFGIPVRGTHAHSWIMLHDDERQAFHEYAEAMPDDCVFLVDTYDSLSGVGHAIEEARALRAKGHELLGIRLDSGDLAWLSQEARRRLDEAGFDGVRILASNDLDENVINSLLKEQGAKIDSFGVGTSLVAARPDAALGGVYKLSAVREGDGWTPRLKLSEQQAKITTPGVLCVRRYRGPSGLVGDLLYDEDLGISERTLIDPTDPTRRKSIPKDAAHEDLLVPIFRAGRRVYQMPPLPETRARAAANVAALDPAIVRFVNPHLYPVGLEPRLHERRMRLILEARTRAR
ncbi:MAG: nicotinate phosphoribosyltransferase [Myxococcales bacterium]